MAYKVKTFSQHTQNLRLLFSKLGAFSRLAVLAAVISATFGIYAQKVLYVSSTRGTYGGEGTITHPLRTIAKAVSMAPQEIRLCRGDTFYERVYASGIDFAPYGEGEKPVVSGLKILPRQAWSLYETTLANKKIWRVSLNFDRDAYRGYKAHGNDYINNIGAIICLTPDGPATTNCKRVRNYADLLSADAQDFDFWQPVEENMKSTSATNFDYLYVCLSEEPLATFGVTMGLTGVTVSDCTVDSIAITCWGRHGIQGGSNVTVRACDIDIIGGMVQLDYVHYVCLGNGIEFYVKPPGKSNCHVERCTISHCYDAGLTVQGSLSDPADKRPLEARNVTFSHNIIKNCCQSFEEFLRGNNLSDVYYDCAVEHNVSISPGIDTGFRYSDGRYKRCHFLGCSYTHPTGMVYRGNICIDGNYRCIQSRDGGYSTGVWEDNLCIINRGQDLLGNYIGTKDVIAVPTDQGDYPTLRQADEAEIRRYRLLTGDTTTEFVIR